LSQSQEKPILIVEDHPLVADATSILLAKVHLGVITTICNTADLALAEFGKRSDWYRIFLDLDVPGAYGLSLVRKFASYGAANRMAIITAFDNQAWQAEARKMGILGYIVKASPIEQFVSAIKDVLNGKPAFTEQPTQVTQVQRLTRRQQDVLCLLQRGYSTKEISAQLRLTPGTVDNHIAGLVRALDVSNRTHAVAKAIELGLLSMDELPKL
jgi:DNA-binding NarL/FixJ family response regulator